MQVSISKYSLKWICWCHVYSTFMATQKMKENGSQRKAKTQLFSSFFASAVTQALRLNIMVLRTKIMHIWIASCRSRVTYIWLFAGWMKDWLEISVIMRELKSVDRIEGLESESMPSMQWMKPMGRVSYFDAESVSRWSFLNFHCDINANICLLSIKQIIECWHKKLMWSCC